MTPEQTPKAHQAQRDMVLRSLMVSQSRQERSEERPRKHVQRLAAPVFVDAPRGHVFVLPVVTEKKMIL